MAHIVSRILLFSLLPLIALILYFEGQHFDPALLNFEASSSGAEGVAITLPDKVSGYSRTGIRSYTKDNLYEYVNGHAEYFISAGFASLTVGEYSRDASRAARPELIIDLYDMAEDIQAFGILSDESGGSLSEVARGITGFMTPQGISFVKGRYYIKISSYAKNIPLPAIAAEIADRLPAASGRTTAFGRFPDIGRVVATRYIKEAYRGLDFVNRVMEREYDVSGENVQVFIATPGHDVVKGLEQSFLDYFRRSGITYGTEERSGVTIYRINDPYEGEWVLVAEPDVVLGIYGSVSDTIIDAVMRRADGRGTRK